jgi:hypothetical protein
MRYDVVFIATGLICLLVGEGVGIWMGANEDFIFAHPHAHLNLLGWVTLCLFGLIHRAYPVLAKSRLAGIQCIAAIVGALMLPVGMAVVILTGNIITVSVGSFIVLLSTLLFAIMFVTGAKPVAA